MNLLTATAGALIANMLTFAMIYGLWRLTKDDRDIKGMLLVAITGFIVAGIGLIGRSTL